MFRRSLPMFFGAKPPRRIPNPPFLHASQKPPEEHNIDFSVLGLKFPLSSPPTFSIERLGWSPKPEATPSLPFLIERTQTGSQLPVYTDYKGGRTKVVTILRKISGDINILKSEVEKVVGKSVTVTPGKIVVDGNYHKRLKLWLVGLGF